MFPEVILTFLLLANPSFSCMSRMSKTHKAECQIQCEDKCFDCQFDISGKSCRGKTENITNITFIPATVQTAKNAY